MVNTNPNPKGWDQRILRFWLMAIRLSGYPAILSVPILRNFFKLQSLGNVCKLIVQRCEIEGSNHLKKKVNSGSILQDDTDIELSFRYGAGWANLGKLSAMSAVVSFSCPDLPASVPCK